jgi:hypothetical protein
MVCSVTTAPQSPQRKASIEGLPSAPMRITLLAGLGTTMLFVVKASLLASRATRPAHPAREARRGKARSDPYRSDDESKE